MRMKPLGFVLFLAAVSLPAAWGGKVPLPMPGMSDPCFEVKRISVLYDGRKNHSRVQAEIVHMGREEIESLGMHLVLFDADGRQMGHVDLHTFYFNPNDTIFLSGAAKRADLRDWEYYAIRVTSFRGVRYSQDVPLDDYRRHWGNERGREWERRKERDRRRDRPAGARDFLLEGVTVRYTDITGLSFITGRVVNNSGRRLHMPSFTITFYDRDRRPLGSLDQSSLSLNPGESNPFAGSIEGDCRDWADYTVHVR